MKTNQIFSDEVTEMNAHRCTDTYALMLGVDCIGCEHNYGEAKAIVAWYSGRKGRTVEIVKNHPDVVRAALKLRGGQRLPVQYRDDMLRDMGLR